MNRIVNRFLIETFADTVGVILLINSCHCLHCSIVFVLPKKL